jgi:hypothetical protein
MTAPTPTAQRVGRRIQPIYPAAIGSKQQRRFERVGQSIRVRDEQGRERGGLGQYPTPQGVAQASRKVRADRLEVRVYGKLHSPYQPDEWGNDWQTFFLPRAEFEAILAQHHAPFEPGHRGAYEQLSDAIMEAANLNYDAIYTIEVGRA